MTLYWLDYLLQPRLYVARAGLAVISVSLPGPVQHDHRGQVVTAPAKISGHESREIATRLAPPPEVIAKPRESVSLAETDPYFPPEDLLSHPQPIADILFDEDCLHEGKIVLKL